MFLDCNFLTPICTLFHSCLAWWNVSRRWFCITVLLLSEWHVRCACFLLSCQWSFEALWGQLWRLNTHSVGLSTCWMISAFCSSCIISSNFPPSLGLGWDSSVDLKFYLTIIVFSYALKQFVVLSLQSSQLLRSVAVEVAWPTRWL